MITFNEFLDKVDNTFLDHHQWRYGQTVMNVLWEVWPEKYQEIKSSDYDCFYQNSVVESTLNKIEKDWPI